MYNILRIRRKRLDRWWWYATIDQFPSWENWIEGQHLIEGVQIDGQSVQQRNSRNGRVEKRLGYTIEGEMEIAQNNIEDFAEIIDLDGPINFAFLCGDQLHIYRLLVKRDGTIFDNRLSFSTNAPSYGETRERTPVTLSGFVREPIEVYRLKPKTTVKIVNGKLRFEAAATRNPDLATTREIGI
jgi:hypothetical protein